MVFAGHKNKAVLAIAAADFMPLAICFLLPPLAQFIQGKLADMYTVTQASRAFVGKVALDADQGR